MSLPEIVRAHRFRDLERQISALREELGTLSPYDPNFLATNQRLVTLRARQKLYAPAVAA